jgi:hypothetical protein
MPSHHSNKQTAASAADSIPGKTETWDDKLEPTESTLRSWLFGPYEKQCRPIFEAKQRMKEQGVSDQTIASALYFEDSVMERRYKQVLRLVTNPKSRKFWTTDVGQKMR